MVIGTIGRLKNSRLNLAMDGEHIEQVHEFKYLGVIIDQHLIWKVHIDMISSKISRTIGYINRIKKYLPNSALILLYNSLILSYFDYCGTLSYFDFVTHSCIVYMLLLIIIIIL